VAQVAPRDGDRVVIKNYPNSFVQTDLDHTLKAAKRRVSCLPDS
jgi:isochorismate hydrolase